MNFAGGQVINQGQQQNAFNQGMAALNQGMAAFNLQMAGMNLNPAVPAVANQPMVNGQDNARADDAEQRRRAEREARMARLEEIRARIQPGLNMLGNRHARPDREDEM